MRRQARWILLLLISKLDKNYPFGIKISEKTHNLYLLFKKVLIFLKKFDILDVLRNLRRKK